MKKSLAVLLSLAAGAFAPEKGTAVPLHLEYLFTYQSPTQPPALIMEIGEIANGARLGGSQAYSASPNWRASAVVDIADDYSTVTFASFQYSQTDLTGGVSDSFDLAFFGSSFYAVQPSSVSFALFNLTVPLNLNGSFQVRTNDLSYLPGYAIDGTRTFLGETQPFSFYAVPEFSAGQLDRRIFMQGVFRPNADLSLVELEISFFQALFFYNNAFTLGAGSFNGVDLELISRPYLEQYGSIASAAPSAVPEPSTFLLVGVCIGVLALTSNSRRFRHLRRSGR